MKTMKRTTACILIALMVLTLLPTTARAATFTVNDESELLYRMSTAAPGDTIALGKDITVTNTGSLVFPAKELTFDLSYYTLTVNNTTGTLTLGSGSVLNITGIFGGKFVVNSDVAGGMVVNGGVVNIEGDVECAFTAENGNGLEVYDGEVNVTDGYLDVQSKTGHALMVGNSGEVNVDTSGGLLNVATNAKPVGDETYYAVYAKDGGKATVVNATSWEEGTWAAYATGAGSRILMLEHAIGHDGNGVCAVDGGVITVNGRVEGKAIGACAIGTDSSVEALGGVTGLCGAKATNGGTVEAQGDVEATGDNSRGIYVAGIGSKVHLFSNLTDPINLTVSGDSAIGIEANDGGTAIVDGAFSVNGDDSVYIMMNGNPKISVDGVPGSGAYIEYRAYIDGSATVYLKAVCSIGSTFYSSLGEALQVALNPAGADETTIKLLADIDYGSGIEVSEKKITFDLDGHSLNIAAYEDTALEVGAGGELLLNNANGGELNVTAYDLGTGDYCYGVYVHDGGKAHVTNVSAIGDYALGTDAESGGFVTVNGNISVYGAETSLGVYVEGSGSTVSVGGNVTVLSGGEATGVCSADGGLAVIDGVLNVPDGGVYIVLQKYTEVEEEGFYQESPRLPGDGTPVMDGPYAGYLCYSDETSFVYVKIQAPGEYAITASAGPGGSISPSGAVTVPAGGSQAFTITPNSGYSIASVTVDGDNKGAVTTYTFNNVTGSHTIGAVFNYTGGGASSPGTSAPGVSTAGVSSVTPSGAALTGKISSTGGSMVTARGFVIGTTPDPVLGGEGVVDIPAGRGTGSFTATADSLLPGTAYYVRAYAVNAAGVSYGQNIPLATGYWGDGKNEIPKTGDGGFSFGILLLSAGALGGGFLLLRRKNRRV